MTAPQSQAMLALIERRIPVGYANAKRAGEIRGDVERWAKANHGWWSERCEAGVPAYHTIRHSLRELLKADRIKAFGHKPGLRYWR